jgi:hypothetical protein
LLPAAFRHISPLPLLIFAFSRFFDVFDYADDCRCHSLISRHAITPLTPLSLSLMPLFRCFHVICHFLIMAISPLFTPAPILFRCRRRHAAIIDISSPHYAIFADYAYYWPFYFSLSICLLTLFSCR